MPGSRPVQHLVAPLDCPAGSAEGPRRRAMTGRQERRYPQRDRAARVEQEGQGATPVRRQVG